MLVAAIEKTGLVAMTSADWKRSHTCRRILFWHPTSSTRRFFARASSLVFGESGFVSPSPSVVRRSAAILLVVTR